MGEPLRSPDTQKVNKELAAIQATLGCLNSEIVQLHRENRRLQSENNLLAEKQARLRSSMEQQKASWDDWAAFDVVEEHYRQVDRQQSNKLAEDIAMLRRTDEATGSPILYDSWEPPLLTKMQYY